MPDTHKIKCLVVDDEPAARDVINRCVQQVPALELVGECSNGMQAMNFLQKQDVDLLFLDIHMPQLSGTELLRVLKNPPKTIFTTAFEKYALESYELDAIDYLLKPVQFHRFLKAVQKVFHMAPSADVQQATASQEPFIYFRVNRKMVKVQLNDILYIESMKDYIKVFTARGVIITKLSISSIEELLPENIFLRTHRSFIVSQQKIKSFSRELIEIEKAEIPIGKLYRQDVLRKLGDF